MADRHDRPDDATILRYLSGTCQPAELAGVERWLEASPVHRAELRVLQAAWTPPPVPDADPDDQMWQWIAARLDEPTPQAAVTVRPAPRLAEPSHSHMRRFGMAAAALLLTLGGAGALWFSTHTSRFDSDDTPSVVVMRDLAAPRGAQVTGNLPDGSRVILGPESRLRVPAKFGAPPSAGGSRDVYLDDGEAFFEVKHDATMPFRVHTRNGIVEDVGTAFVVTAYPELEATRIVVASGVVALQGNDSRARRDVTLRAGDVGRLRAGGAEVLVRHVDITPYVGWTAGTLAFDAVPVREVIATLGRWYNLDIRLADSSAADRRFTASFHNEPVSHVLRVLEATLDVRVERIGQRVLLRARVPAVIPSR